MILRIFRITVEPVDPLRFSLTEFRSSLTRELEMHPGTALPGDPCGKHLHRYPALQCKQVKNELMVIGICQGAAFLAGITEGHREIVAVENRCIIRSRDPGPGDEEFGLTGGMHEYEFLTPWLALNQQHAKKFYELKGKPARDAFMQALLATHLGILAKSLDYVPDAPITCTAHVRFIRERIDRENLIVFLGRFRTNLRIPDYLGMGRSVSQGFGTIRGYANQGPESGDSFDTPGMPRS